MEVRVQEKELLAAYGELLRDPAEPGSPDLMPACRLLGACWIPGVLLDLDGHPGLVPGEGQVVLGELYEVIDADAFARIDVIEGYDAGDQRGSRFVRRRIELVEPEAVAWVYLYNHLDPGSGTVQSGDWRGHLAERAHLR